MILLILFLHFFGDFILQSTYMGQNKSKSNKVLGTHCFLYSLPLMVIGWKFALINGVFHFLVDWVTSRMTSKLWAEQEVHWFFVVIGMDQMIHTMILFGTYLII